MMLFVAAKELACSQGSRKINPLAITDDVVALLKAALE
jgi:hypothetical protein